LTVVTANGTSEVIANPEKYLNQHTLSFQFSELFPNVSSLATVVAAIYNSDPNNAKKTVRLDSQLCRGSSAIECLASGGKFWERFLSGVSGNVSLSERDEIQQGILLTNFPSSLHYGPAGEIDFDPASLFVTAASWKTAVASLKGITVETNREETDCFMKAATATDQSPKERQNCVNKFARPRFSASMEQGRWTRFGALLIPKFQFKAISQFDFIKNGGALVSEPGLQRSLKNYMFIWDLKRVIPSTADRVAALAAYRSYSMPKTQAASVAQPKLCVTISGSSRGYVPVGDNFTADGCRMLAMNARAGSFALACAAANSIAIGDPSPSGEPIGEVHLPESNTCSWN